MSSIGDLVLGAHQTHALGDIDLESLGSGVTIRAAGEKANLLLDGSGTATLSCVPSVLAMTQSSPTEGKIDMHAGMAGTITASIGLPIIGPQIKIEAQKITLSIGPPGAGAMIEITPTGITLQV